MIWRLVNLFIVLLAVALGACGQDQSAQSTPGLEVIRGQPTVETVEIVIDPSDPEKAEIVARGYLADGCTRIDSVQVSPGRGNLLASVTITTVRPADFACIQVTKPFEQRIAVTHPARREDTQIVEVNGVAHPVRLGPGNGGGTE